MADTSFFKQNLSSNQQLDQTDDHHASSSPESLSMVQPIPNTSTQQPIAMFQVPNKPQYGFTIPNSLMGMPSLNQDPNNINNQQPYLQYFILQSAQPHPSSPYQHQGSNPSHYINVDPQPNNYSSTTPTIIHVSSNPMSFFGASFGDQPNPSTPPPTQYLNQPQETPEPPEASAQPNPSKPATPPQSPNHPKINQTPPPVPLISLMAQPFSQPINSSTTQPPNYPCAFYQAPAQINPPTTTPMILIPSSNEQNISTPPPPIAGQCPNNINLQNQPPEPDRKKFTPPQTPDHSPDHQKDQIFSTPPAYKAPTGLGGSPNKKGALANRAGNLANLLPTGTVLAFQALVPSLSNNGKCEIFNKYIVGLVIAFCGITCFLSSFTDSFKVGDKVYYGFATPKGLCIFNYENGEEEEGKVKEEAKRYHMEFIDFVHAFGSLIVFVVFAISSADVLDCYFPKADDNKYSVIIYLPLVAGVLSSFLFSIFPTKRKGIGIADNDVRH